MLQKFVYIVDHFMSMDLGFYDSKKKRLHIRDWCGPQAHQLSGWTLSNFNFGFWNTGINMVIEIEDKNVKALRWSRYLWIMIYDTFKQSKVKDSGYNKSQTIWKTDLLKSLIYSDDKSKQVLPRNF